MAPSPMSPPHGEDELIQCGNLIAPSPLVGEGGAHERSECGPGEGSASADRDPSPGSPPLPRRRSTLSHKGRGCTFVIAPTRQLKHRAVADHLDWRRAVGPALEGELASRSPGAAFENPGQRQALGILTEPLPDHNG